MGLLAGWGRYPLVVGEALLRQGYEVYCLGIRDHADPALRAIATEYREIGVGKLGRAIRFFRRRGVGCATMAGKLHKVLLFQRFAMWKHLPDWRAVRTFFPHWVTKTRDRKDDTLLLAVIEAFAADGIHFAPATDFVPELLVKPGNLAGRTPLRGQWKDIQFGWQLAKEMGRLDVGQSVAVKGRAVLAVEAVEGTDLCIQRAGELCPQGGWTLVKVAKPQQDMRFDVPTIGIHTVRNLVAARAAVLAVEAGKTIIVDEAQVVAYARQHHLTLVAVDAATVARADFA